MRTVLAYGDSLTWGYNAETKSRHAYEDRWTSVLQKALGHGVRVIPEGLNGRTTVYDDYEADCDRNGARILPTVLHSHMPVDLVILFLGANDMKRVIAGSAVAATRGMQRLIQLVRGHNGAWNGGEAPAILVVSPPHICETADIFFSAMFAGGIKQSRMLGQFYADLADEEGCGFFDAASVAVTTPVDGVHLDAENSRAIGRGVEPIVRMMLGL